MRDFLLVFRRDNGQPPLSPEQLQQISEPWKDWIDSIAAQGKLSSMGSRLEVSGKVIRPGNVVTDGPYVEIKEAIGGYTVVSARDLDEAASLAVGCPILSVGGSVEVRPIVRMEQNS